MDIITVLTKVVQEQQNRIREQQKMIEQLRGHIQRFTQEQEKMAQEQWDIAYAHAERIARLERLLASRGN